MGTKTTIELNRSHAERRKGLQMNNFKNYLRVASKIATIFTAVVLMVPPLVERAAAAGPLSESASATVSVFATGLNNPRGLKFGPDGISTSLKAALAAQTQRSGSVSRWCHRWARTRKSNRWTHFQGRFQWFANDGRGRSSIQPNQPEPRQSGEWGWQM